MRSCLVVLASCLSFASDQGTEDSMINEYEHEGLRCVGSWIRHSPIAYERAAWCLQHPKICGTGQVRPTVKGGAGKTHLWIDVLGACAAHPCDIDGEFLTRMRCSKYVNLGLTRQSTEHVERPLQVRPKEQSRAEQLHTARQLARSPAPMLPECSSPVHQDTRSGR